MKFQIKNRFSGNVQYECELSAEMAGKSYGCQLGFAIKNAMASGSDLSGSDLSGSDLRRSNLRGSVLSDCDLHGSDLSGSDLSGSDLRHCDMRRSNLRGSVLSDCDLIGSDLRNCDMRGSDLSGSDLRHCDMRRSNLRDCNLHGSDLRDCDLHGSDMRGSYLIGCDWIPKIKNIHTSIYEIASKPGALDMGKRHCGTTHCRAGWAVVLAGDGGRVLEGVYGTAAAAALIYQASDPELEKIPDFYASDDEALADMKKMAEAEASRPPAEDDAK